MSGTCCALTHAFRLRPWTNSSLTSLSLLLLSISAFFKKLEIILNQFLCLIFSVNTLFFRLAKKNDRRLFSSVSGDVTSSRKKRELKPRRIKNFSKNQMTESKKIHCSESSSLNLLHFDDLVFFEIASHLGSARDLLALSRTCKLFATRLSKDSYAEIWQNACLFATARADGETGLTKFVVDPTLRLLACKPIAYREIGSSFSSEESFRVSTRSCINFAKYLSTIDSKAPMRCAIRYEKCFVSMDDESYLKIYGDSGSAAFANATRGEGFVGSFLFLDLNYDKARPSEISIELLHDMFTDTLPGVDTIKLTILVGAPSAKKLTVRFLSKGTGLKISQVNCDLMGTFSGQITDIVLEEKFDEADCGKAKYTFRFTDLDLLKRVTFVGRRGATLEEITENRTTLIHKFS